MRLGATGGIFDRMDRICRIRRVGNGVVNLRAALNFFAVLKSVTEFEIPQNFSKNFVRSGRGRPVPPRGGDEVVPARGWRASQPWAGVAVPQSGTEYVKDHGRRFCGRPELPPFMAMTL